MTRKSDVPSVGIELAVGGGAAGGTPGGAALCGAWDSRPDEVEDSRPEEGAVLVLDGTWSGCAKVLRQFSRAISSSVGGEVFSHIGFASKQIGTHTSVPSA